LRLCIARVAGGVPGAFGSQRRLIDYLPDASTSERRGTSTPRNRRETTRTCPRPRACDIGRRIIHDESLGPAQRCTILDVRLPVSVLGRAAGERTRAGPGWNAVDIGRGSTRPDRVDLEAFTALRPHGSKLISFEICGSPRLLVDEHGEVSWAGGAETDRPQAPRLTTAPRLGLAVTVVYEKIEFAWFGDAAWGACAENRKTGAFWRCAFSPEAPLRSKFQGGLAALCRRGLCDAVAKSVISLGHAEPCRKPGFARGCGSAPLLLREQTKAARAVPGPPAPGWALTWASCRAEAGRLDCFLDAGFCAPRLAASACRADAIVAASSGGRNHGFAGGGHCSFVG